MWVKEEKDPCLLSFKGGSEGAVSETSPLMRRFENAHYSTHYARSPRRFVSPTAGTPRVRNFCIFTWSSDRMVDACRWRAQQLLGAPGPSLPQEGAFAGQAPGGYCRCFGYRGISVYLLLGPFIGPASAQGRNDDRSSAEKTLMRRRLMRRTTAKRLRTRRPPHELFLVRGRITSMSALHVSVLSKKIGAEDCVPSTLPPTGRRPTFAMPA
jgi:hypothetical protein